MLVCTCLFQGVGNPMKTGDCKIHTELHYPCPETKCPDYRPSREPTPSKGSWPLCVCGKLAQDH